MGCSPEKDFTVQSETFKQLVMKELGLERLEQAPIWSRQNVQITEPLIIDDYKRITAEQRILLKRAYYSSLGVAHLLVLNADQQPTASHPLFDITGQIRDLTPSEHALPHPLEQHPDVYRDFGKADGTVKVRDVPKQQGAGYREQGETSEAFDMHHDGFGSGGTVESVFLYCDSPPLWGGFTYFQNICALSLDLARLDPEAFQSLFLPDAVTMLRPRGKGALKVTSPVLYINEAGRPQSNFRKSTGEYVIRWRSDPAPLRRAEEFLNENTKAFPHGGTFVHFGRAGQCCIVRNESIAHGRTHFVNGAGRDQIRCLSRKWFMRRAQDAIYKHVPGISILESYAQLFPEQFGPDVLSGEWLYDAVQDRNLRKPDLPRSERAGVSVN